MTPPDPPPPPPTPAEIAALAARERLLQWIAAQAHRRGLPWLLRGSVLTRELVRPAPREIKDVDWVDPRGIDLPGWSEALPRLLEGAPPGLGRVEPGVLLYPFAETPFPGARLPFSMELPVEGGSVTVESQIEVAGGDPITGQPVDLPLGAPGAPVEDLFAWKTHGLFEYGRGKWRAKDLLDCALLLRHAPPDPDRLPAALRAAFRARQTSLSVAMPMILGTWGISFSAGRKWRKFRKRYAWVTGELEEIRDPVTAFLVPLLRAELARELADGWQARPFVPTPADDGCDPCDDDRLPLPG